jgi:cytochrome c oxidase cbb3-type subunit 3
VLIAGAPAAFGQASRPRPKPTAPQTYTADQIREGAVQFSAQCGFCHGKDASGGESGPDLTRSELVAQDTKGDKLGPFIRTGKPNAGMPAFDKISDLDLNVIVAFVHDQMEKSASLGGNRRQVSAADLATGDAKAGKAYFEGAGKCSSCHSATGDLAGIGKRIQGLQLMQRFLYPGGRGGPGLKGTFTVANNQTVVAPVVSEDEFSITVIDPTGARQTYPRNAVKVKIDDPMSAHYDQLAKYTDTDIHNIYAYLETLK